jgi:FixJ family two-component response regulator
MLASQERAVSSRRVISIVDDDASFRRAMATLVRSLGNTAATFGSAEEFLSSDRVGQTACLVSDMRMPGMSGLDLQARLHAEGSSIPIIFVAVDPSINARTKALAAGALAFLDKPFDEERLVSLLSQVLGR